MKFNYKIIYFILAVIVTLFFITPYIYLVLSSFKPSAEVVMAPPNFLPSRFTLENYLSMKNYMPVGHYFYNSIVAASVSTFIAISLGSLAAYALVRLNFKYVGLLITLVLCLKMIPISGIAVPIYGIINKIGLYDHVAALILVYTAVNLPFVIWMMIGFFGSVPKELDEASYVDGASSLRTFFKIILPVSLTGIITTTIFTMLLNWNDFFMALLLTGSNAKTMPVGLSEFLTAYSLDLGPMTAAATLFSLPVLIISMFMQKYMIKGLTAGAVKG